MISRSDLMNAFQPATELDDPERFAGREKQVRALADSLHSVGSVPLIYGDRGLGKSSLALQLRRIAMGDIELLADLESERLAVGPDEFYLVFYATCTDSTKNLEDILQLLVNAAESVETIGAGEDARLIDRKTRRKLTVKFFEHETTRTYATAIQRLSYQDLNLEEKLVQLCEILTATYSQRVLFVIDELDRVEDPSGLASFLKAVSSDYLKFVLVGIAGNVSDLLADHRSLERRLVPVRVPAMNPRELGEIVSKAERYLISREYEVNFEADAIVALVLAASGYPWFVHVLGQQCLLDADNERRSTISAGHVAKAIDAIVENRFAQQFSDLYQMAVRDSWRREQTLRAFAHWDDTDIPTSEVYRIVEELGVKGPSTYKGHLCQDEYGGVLTAPAFQKRGLVRFKNDMFKAYVRMRPSIYSGVDERIRVAYGNRG